MSSASFGRAVGLALLSLSLVTCGGGAGDEAAPAVSTEKLRSGIEGPKARAFYEARGWAAAWDEDSARQLQQALANAPAHGLKREMFLPRLPEEPSGREIALTRAALLYGSALA